MPKTDTSRVAGLIDQIYEAAALPELWRRLLAEISDAAGTPGAALCVPSPSGFMPVCSESLDEAVDIGLRTGWLKKGAPSSLKSVCNVRSGFSSRRASSQLRWP